MSLSVPELAFFLASATRRGAWSSSSTTKSKSSDSKKTGARGFTFPHRKTTMRMRGLFVIASTATGRFLWLRLVTQVSALDRDHSGDDLNFLEQHGKAEAPAPVTRQLKGNSHWKKTNAPAITSTLGPREPGAVLTPTGTKASGGPVVNARASPAAGHAVSAVSPGSISREQDMNMMYGVEGLHSDEHVHAALNSAMPSAASSSESSPGQEEQASPSSKTTSWTSQVFGRSFYASPKTGVQLTAAEDYGLAFLQICKYSFAWLSVAMLCLLVTAGVNAFCCEVRALAHVKASWLRVWEREEEPFFEKQQTGERDRRVAAKP